MKVLIVDGYNIIHRISRLESLLNKSLQASRSGLEGMLRIYASKQRTIEKIYVVYDGKSELYAESGGRGLLCIVYTAKGQSADEVIVSMLKRIVLTKLSLVSWNALNITQTVQRQKILNAPNVCILAQ